jgi:hypothetical protein
VNARRTLLLVASICAAPVLASVVAFCALRPSARMNYGDLVEPPRPWPPLSLTRLDGNRFEMSSLQGRWVMLSVDRGECDSHCIGKLWQMRQLRLAAGADRERIERVWLIDGEAVPDARLLAEFAGTIVARLDPSRLRAALPLPQAAGAAMADPIWLLDPAGAVMLRWPRDADPRRMKRDLDRLLSVSRTD